MTFDYKEDWCNDCLYVNDKNRECMCIRNCHKGNQKVVYEESFNMGKQIMLAKENLKREVK